MYLRKCKIDSKRRWKKLRCLTHKCQGILGQGSGSYKRDFDKVLEKIFNKAKNLILLEDINVSINEGSLTVDDKGNYFMESIARLNMTIQYDGRKLSSRENLNIILM